MRVTAEEQAKTRQKLLDKAESFLEDGSWPALTTRKLAEEAGVGAGTLFNYFESKEDVVATLLNDWLARAQKSTEPLDAGSLEELLFAHIMRDLRELKHHKNAVKEALTHVLTPLAESTAINTLRQSKIASITDIARLSEGIELSPAAKALAWSVYLGVLSFWVQDKSRKGEQTLAFVDDATHTLAEVFRSSAVRKSKQHKEQL